MAQITNYFNSLVSNDYLLEKRKKDDAAWLEQRQSYEERITRINNQLKNIASLNARLKELDPSTEISVDPSALREERGEHLLKMIRDLSSTFGFDEKNIFIHIQDDFYISAQSRQVTEKGGVILVSPFFLLEARDLIDFQVTGVNDPKLFDDHFLERAKKHIEKILNIKKDSKLLFFNKNELGLFLLLMQKPEKWEETKKFIFCHELEHIHLKHTYKEFENRRPTGTILATSISTALLGYFDVFQQILPSSLLWTVAAATTSTWVWMKWNESGANYTKELEADKGAVKKLKNIEGIDYIMKSKMEFNKVSRASSKLFSLIYTSQGESLLDKFGNYPSSKERLKNAVESLGSRCL